VVLGLLPSIATPNAGTACGMSLCTMNCTKQAKVQANCTFIMVFADLMDLPNCFIILLHRKSDFQSLFNVHHAKSYMSFELFVNENDKL